MFEWFGRHWRAFWRSGPETLYTYIWWAIFTAIAAGVLSVGAWLLARVRGVSPVVAIIAARWEDRFLAIFVAMLFITLATWITRHRIIQNQKARLAEQPALEASSPLITAWPATVKDLFESDWPDLPAYYNVSVLQVGKEPENREMKLAWRLNADFQARSQFLAFFLEPKLSSIDVVDICVFLADHYQQFIDIANSEVDIAGKWPTDTSTTHLRDLTFSRRIFIYHGNLELSLEQMGSIEVLYKQKGLSIQFRGTDYWWLHRNDHPNRRPKSPEPGVLLPRALGTGFIISVTKLSP